MKHYYLTTSLPWLDFNGPVPVSSEGFLYECGKWLQEEEMKFLEAALSDGTPVRKEYPGPLKEWKLFDSGLREQIAGLRAAMKSGDKKKPPPQLKNVFEAENPLSAEKELEKKRWDFLEALSSDFYFDINWLVLYAAKLRILERIGSFDKDKGENIFYNLCEVTYGQEQR